VTRKSKNKSVSQTFPFGDVRHPRDSKARGGLPIIRKGKLEGAIGPSGARTNEQDEDRARAGIDASTGDG
jgi:uncharacterized protein GlcG (DUF336 family)